MDSKKLISELSVYMKTNSLKNAKVETDIGLPKNSLSNFLSMKKELPDKWVQPILKYCLGELSGKVTTADKIPVSSSLMESKEVIGNHVGYHTTDKNTIEWIVNITKYCESEGITPEDLISSHKERFKTDKLKKGSKVSKNNESEDLPTKNETASSSYWFSDYRKKKLGL